MDRESKGYAAYGITFTMSEPPDYADPIDTPSTVTQPKPLRMRHNHRPRKNSRTSSSGRYRQDFAPVATVFASASSFILRSACR